LNDAAAAFDDALAAEPNRAKALIGRASVAMQRGEPSAPALLQRAKAAQPGNRDVTLQLAEAMEAEGDPQAIAVLDAVVRAEPDWVEGQRILARMRWEAGEGDRFTEELEQRLAETPNSPQLWYALVDALASADLHARAAQTARRGQQAIGDDPRLIASEAMHSSEEGDGAAAESAYARLDSALPGVAIAEARHRLRTGEWDRAEQLVARELQAEPWSVRGWALQGLLWRLRENSRSEWLHDQPGLYAAHQLDLEVAQISKVADRLRSLHQTRAHPLGQSLRGGTQTRGRLFERLEPEVVLLREAVRRTLERHWDSLPPLDETHPLLRHRDARPQFAGSWSVRLTDGGFHVAHIHPRGVISSACYLVVPPIGGEEGHLEIGGPPPELGLPLAPLASFAPLPGRMILFPSTLFHGTRPFPTGERLTAAFDVVPA
jgi:Tfp pilus assembly protein PilF